MPVRSLNRNQTWLFPPNLDELIPRDHPARFVAAFVDALDWAAWEELGINIDGEALGAPEYHPRGLLGVWLYGFMTRTRSSRKLESACRDQLPYLWLTGWQHPDHNTLWRFYRDHRRAMRGLLKRTVQTAVRMDLVDLAVQAVDGTKVAANAAKNRTYGLQQLGLLLERTEKAIQDLETENEAGNDPVPVHLPEKLAEAQQLREQVKAAMEQLAEDGGRKRINLTDGDAELMKGGQGMVVGYNAQAVVSPVKIEEKVEKKNTGLMITAADVSTCASDAGHLVPMLEQAEDNAGKRAGLSLADAGYHSGANLEACAEREQVVVMPEAQQRRLEKAYHKDKFQYDENTDAYACPQGQTLHFRRMKNTKGTLVRQYWASLPVCRQCLAFGTCTRNRTHGRMIEIGPHDSLLRRHRAWMATEEARRAYSRRKELPEPVFGILKEQLGLRRFLLRGTENVKAEWTTLATAFNLRTLWRCWVKGKLQSLCLRALSTTRAISDRLARLVDCFALALRSPLLPNTSTVAPSEQAL